jgi:hypothetical protein
MEQFRERTLIIATKHKKEEVIAPILERSLGVKIRVPEGLDTDRLGTFTGEVEREHDPITTMRYKCDMAMETTGADLAVASEGSFGPHPTLMFVPADEEWLMLKDRRLGLEIKVRELSTDTNYAQAEVRTDAELLSFAERALFPSHALIMSAGPEAVSDIRKGITDRKELMEAFAYYMQRYGCTYVQTDMRAMYNPTRMRVIARAAEVLIARVQSLCPECSTPGYGVVRAVAGLPCSLCGSPTRSTLAYVSGCSFCGYEQQQLYPTGRTTEEPLYCDHCNP